MPFTAHRDVIPSHEAFSTVDVQVAPRVPGDARALIVPLAPGDDLPGGVPDWEQLHAAGFTGAVEQTLVIPGSPAPTVLAGLGSGGGPDRWRDAAATASRAARPATTVAVLAPGAAAERVRALVEGALLARYRYDALRGEAAGAPLTALTVVGAADADGSVEVTGAARAGQRYAQVTALARDLANTPHNHLTASRFAEIARDLGAEAGIEVDVWEQQQIAEAGLGGLLAINAGGAEPPRMVRLRYTPPGPPTGRLGLVGKGIMYDSGGIGLKPNDDTHSQMKNDMTGAAAILAAMLALPGLGGTAAVTGYLMCTDNMPSATATAFGDVVRIRNGRTVEIIDTDAEGRMVMSDGLCLAVEDGTDALIDIATLTGSVSRALGPRRGGLFASDDDLADWALGIGLAVGEPFWHLPLVEEYRQEIDSPVADLRNVAPVGIPDGIIAALFLREFTSGVPWVHLDIAGVGWNSRDVGWYSPGCTGWGARLIAQAASSFTSAGGR